MKMNLIEMEGFLRGKCLPGDIKTGESNAEYLVRKFSELHEQLEESQREFRSADITMQNLEAQLKQSKIDADCYKKGMEASNARLVQLAAENAELKTAAKETLAHWAAAEAGEMELMMDKCIPALRDAYCETQATDAFLAEVRAQGVERLANAWYAIANETDPGISISDSSRLKYRQRADDAADFANEIRQEAAQ